MTLIVQKFGGTSVANVDRIKSVAARVAKVHESGTKIVVVLSAMSGETNRLTALAKQLNPRPSKREMDVLLTTGEQVTISLLSIALHNLGLKAKSYTGSQVRILTDDSHSKARIKNIDADKIIKDLDSGYIVVVAGFQGIDSNGNITTLGRGGSDTSAVAIAAALSADECQIYTDVDGVYTTDPRVVSEARRMRKISFEEMLEMASLGSKVLQIRAVEFAGKYNVPLRVLSSFSESGEGTLITLEDREMEQVVISGIAFSRDEARLTIKGVPDKPGIASSILSAIANANIEVDMIVQNVSNLDGSSNFTFTVSKSDLDQAVEILGDLSAELTATEVISERDIAKISLVGVGMRSHAGIASKMFEFLAAENINIKMISTSEIKISVVIEEKYLELAVRSLHEGFGLDQE